MESQAVGTRSGWSVRPHLLAQMLIADSFGGLRARPVKAPIDIIRMTAPPVNYIRLMTRSRAFWRLRRVIGGITTLRISECGSEYAGRVNALQDLRFFLVLSSSQSPDKM